MSRAVSFWSPSVLMGVVQLMIFPDKMGICGACVGCWTDPSIS